MSTLLCVSCGHTFPENLLEPAAFSDRLGRCLSQTAQLVRDTEGRTHEDTHRLVQVTQLLQQLCGMVQEEVQLLHGRQKDSRNTAAAAARGGTNAAGMKNGSDALSLTPAQQQQQQQQAGNTMMMNGTFGSTTRQQMMMLSTVDRNAAPNKMFDGAVPSYQLRRMVSAFDLVSATLYNMLEALAVQCRASVALLWLRPRQNASAELVAPFVVGRELASLAHSAPYSTPESSVPCVVCQTGIALNLLPQPQPPAVLTPALAADLSLTELMEQTNAAQLLVPVHDRYTERNAAVSAAGAQTPATTAAAATRASATAAAAPPPVLAVVHLIGSPLHPVPFHRHNEEAAAQTAALLSSVLSSYYDAMMAEWANRFYIPTTLQATARYAAGLDMRPEEKVMDDFTAPPLLIYRCAVGDPREGQSANEARDAVKVLQANALHKSTPLRPMANVKDLCQHATNMEANWVAAVQQTARLEKEIATLEEAVLRRDVGAMQRARDGANGGGARRSLVSASLGNTARNSLPGDGRRGGAATTTTTATGLLKSSPGADTFRSPTTVDMSVELSPAVTYPVESAAEIAAAGNPMPPLSGDVLKPEEVEMLEAATLRRLKNLGADTTIFESTS